MTPVKYKGVMVGYIDTNDVCQFNDTEEAKEVKRMLNNKQRVGISSRATGSMNEDGTHDRDEPSEYSIIEPES